MSILDIVRNLRKESKLQEQIDNIPENVDGFKILEVDKVPRSHRGFEQDGDIPMIRVETPYVLEETQRYNDDLVQKDPVYLDYVLNKDMPEPTPMLLDVEVGQGPNNKISPIYEATLRFTGDQSINKFLDTRTGTTVTEHIMRKNAESFVRANSDDLVKMLSDAEMGKQSESGVSGPEL